MWACCPFHEEKTPSFSVSPSKNIYKCFGCGKAGDPIQFVMDMEGLGFTEAIKYLAEKYGIPIEESFSQEDLDTAEEKESISNALQYASRLFQQLLWNHEEGKSIGLSYLKERGLTEAIIKKFELGYTLDQWDYLLKEADNAGYKPDVLEKAGLIIVKPEQDKKYDRFRGRVMFPIHSVAGKPIAFGGRVLSNNSNQPKYINSPETEVYHKSKVLYGLFQAKQRIRQEDNCYLVEGYMDVIAMHMAQVENVVAPSGTSLTEEQIKLIKRYTSNLTVLFDGDAAGLKASMRSIDLILEAGMQVKAVALPEGDDPDSYVKQHGTSAFQEYIQQQAQDFVQFKAALLQKETGNDPIGKARAIHEIVESVAKIPDAIQRTLYLKECSSILDIEEEVLISELNKIVLKKRKEKRFDQPQTSEEVGLSPEMLTGAAQKSPVKSASDALMLQEKEAIRLLLHYGHFKAADERELCNYLLEELESVEFQNEVYRSILEEYKEKLTEGILPDDQYFLKNGTEEQKQVLYDLHQERYTLSELWMERFKIYTPHEREMVIQSAFMHILRFKHRFILHLVKKNQEEIKEAAPGQLDELLAYQMQLNQTKKEVGELLGMVVVR